jgi:hypothetical protein
MTSAADRIIEHLGRVNAERAHRQLTPGLAARVDDVKRYQQRRFAATYWDLLGSERYARAANFFLNELYGPQDFRRRDAQFLRVVPALVRLFPADVVDTVCRLAELHELSEALDTRMGLAVPIAGGPLCASAYVLAWQACGRAPDRDRQISLTIQLGRMLDHLTRKPVLRHSLRMMRGPARAAGLAELQVLLESGFDAFKVMGGAKDFLKLVEERERRLAVAMFSVRVDPANHSDAGVRLLIPELP